MLSCIIPIMHFIINPKFQCNANARKRNMKNTLYDTLRTSFFSLSTLNTCSWSCRAADVPFTLSAIALTAIYTQPVIATADGEKERFYCSKNS